MNDAVPDFRDLSQYRVLGLDIFYIPDFVTQDEEEYLVRKIIESPQQKWKQLTNRRLQLWGGEITAKNVLLSQAMPSFIDVYPDIITRLKNTGIFASSPHGAPNHIILNEYLPGQGIMPHEDGPAYHPVVATISLGSHTVFHYYAYKTEDLHSSDKQASISDQGGRTIDPTPVQTVFLEPRSLIISSGPMYTSHLHGIRGDSEDRICRKDPTCSPTLDDLYVTIDNWEMVSGEEVQNIMQKGGVLKRGIRYSLTCRDVERVSGCKSLVLR